jgi:hypothetical protein
MSDKKIGIGINEPVYLAKALINEKDTLELYWDYAEEDAVGKDLFADLTGDEIQDDGSSRLMIWALKVPDKADMTADKKLDRISGDIETTKNQLIHIMESYMTKDQIKGTFKDIFDSTPITDANTYPKFILDQTVLDVVTKNIFSAFISKMADFIGKPELKKRLLLVRQAKDKAFPVLRKYYLKDNPFLEDADIPRTDDPKTNQSKLKFTKYELKEGLDDDTPVSRSSADKTDEKTTDGSSSNTELSPESVFGR